MKLYNITIGEPKKIFKPALYGVLSNIINVLPFALAIEAVRLIFSSFAQPGITLDLARLWLVCGSMVLTIFVMFGGEVLAYRAAYRGAYLLAATGRVKLAEHLRKLPLGAIISRDSGGLSNMMMGDFALIEHSLSHLVPQLIGALVLPLLAFLLLLFLDWRMAVTMFAALPVVILLTMLTAKLQLRLGGGHMKAKISAINRLQEYLNGIRVIKAHNLTGERFIKLEEAFRNLMTASIKFESLVVPAVMAAIVCIRAGLPLMVFIGVHLLLGGELSIVAFVTFLLIGTRIFDPLTTVLINFAELSYNEQAGRRIVELYTEPIMRGLEVPPNKYDITLEQVTFQYGDSFVLANVSLQIPEGSLTAFVGPSGGGKSTVFKLIARFYDPQQGRVLLGGKDIKTIEPELLLEKISVVFQDVYLFQDTIGNNIRMGRQSATQQEVEEAAQRACCHTFIMQLPQGYNTPVGEGGCTLSGGEKQRISIARAILKDAPVVLLDEATAALDPENEQDIQKAINELIHGRTVIVIAHKLKTVSTADQIVVLADGQVVEQGQHRELLAGKGLYSQLWDLQQTMQGWRISS